MCWSWSPYGRPTFSTIMKEIRSRVERIEKKRYQKTIARNQIYVNVSTGPYYNSGNESGTDFGASTSASSAFFSSVDIHSESISSIEQTEVNYNHPDTLTNDL